RCSCTKRTARSRTSGENLFDLFMAPSSQELEPPENPGRFTDEFSKQIKEFVRRVSYWRTGNVDLQARLTEANAAIAELRRRRDVGILPSA
ncbi:hypothetical protein, partial [Ideonella margarita]